MATPTSIHPEDPRATAWKAFARVAKTALASVANPVLIPDGNQQNDMTSDLPANKWAVRLTPQHHTEEAIATGRTLGERLWNAPIEVQVEVRTVGNNADNSVNLFGRLCNALKTNADRLLAGGITDWTVVKPATSSLPDVTTVGAIRLEVCFFR